MIFHKGQKVVCINDDPITETDTGIMHGNLSGLTKGQTYTVRQAGLICPLKKGVPCIRVEEIVRPNRTIIEHSDMPYRADRFRPLVEKKTDISELEKLLNTKQLEEV